MNTVRRLASAAIALLFSMTATAYGACSSCRDCKADNGFYAGLSCISFDYSEVGVNSNESGTIPMAAVGYEYFSYTRNSPYFRVNVEFSNIDIEYDGQTQCRAETFSHDNELFSAEADVGYTFQTRNWSVTPFIGIAYHKWDRDLSRHPAGYREVYTWWTAPIGIRLLYYWDEKWSSGLNLAVAFMHDAEMDLSGLGPGYTDPSFSLGNKPGYRVEIPIDYWYSEHWKVSFTPFYRLYKFGRSAPRIVMQDRWGTASMYEPESKTTISGLAVTIKYSF